MENSIQKIFVVDDNKFHLSSVEQIIKNLGYTDIFCYSNGVDCINGIHLNPDVVLLDHEMDEYSGYEVLNKIKRYNPNIFVIMVSGQEDIDIVVNSLKYGAFDYIQKNSLIENRIEEVFNKLNRINTLIQTNKKISKFQQFSSFFKKKISFLSFLLLIITSLFFFSSCKTLNVFADAPDDDVYANDSIFYKKDYEYTIRKNDKISISVWEQDQLSVGSIYGIYNSNEVYGKWMLVDAQGNIEGPKVGTIHVEGLTIIELKAKLKTEFQSWVKKPIVDVKVLNNEISVLGEVKNPSKVKFDGESTTLLETIAHCQGFDEYADIRKIKILRENGDEVEVANVDLSENGDLAALNLKLVPGDVVLVPSKKHKEFDKRIANIIPIASSITAAVVLLGLFIK